MHSHQGVSHSSSGGRFRKNSWQNIPFLQKNYKLLGDIMPPQGIQPIAIKVRDLKKLKSPKSKRDVMKVLECLGFYSWYFKNLHVDSQTFYELIKGSTLSSGQLNTRNFSNQLRTRSVETLSLLCFLLNIPLTFRWSRPMLEPAVLSQQFPEGELVISFICRIFDTVEHKMSTLHRELFGIVLALQTYEHYDFRSPFPIVL